MAEIPKLDMTKEELQYTVALMLDLTATEIKALSQQTLIKMLNNLNRNAMAFNILEDKYRELLTQDTYKPLAPKMHNARHKENRAMAKEVRKLRKETGL